MAPTTVSRRQFLTGGAARRKCGRRACWRKPRLAGAPLVAQDIAFVNGRIHTMDRARRVVSQLLIREPETARAHDTQLSRATGIFEELVHSPVVEVRANAAVALCTCDPRRTLACIGPLGEAVAQGNWGVAVGLRANLSCRRADGRDAVPRAAAHAGGARRGEPPVYINAAQGGVRTNSLGKAWLEKQGVIVAADGTIAPNATGATHALKLLREQFLTPESRKRSAFEAMNYYAGLGITTHLDNGAFHSELPSGGVATENTYTMHQPFLALAAEQRLPARLRFNYLHQDPPNDPSLPTLACGSAPRCVLRQRLVRSGGIGSSPAAAWTASARSPRRGGAPKTTRSTSRRSRRCGEPREGARGFADEPALVLARAADRAGARQPLQGDRRRSLVGWGPLRTGSGVGHAARSSTTASRSAITPMAATSP
jgi:hypothetical protein